MSQVILRSRLAATAAIAIVLTALAPATAQAAPVDDQTPDGVRSHYSDIQLLLNPDILTPISAKAAPGVTMRAASFTVTCTPTADTPHRSAGAGGVIYKTRVVCKGTGAYPASVTIRVRGGLFFDAAAYNGDTSNVSWSQVRSSDESRAVPVNGTTNTFYTPKAGVSGYTGTGHYQGSSTVTITSPTGQTVGSDISYVAWLNP